MFDDNLCSNIMAPADASPVSVQTIIGRDDCLSTPIVSADAGKESVDHINKVFYSKKVDKGTYHSIYYANLDTYNNKKDEIIDIINSESPDILAFTELLNKKCPTITKAELKLTGYDEFYSDEDINDKIIKRRGVILYAKKALNAQVFNGFENHVFKEHMWCSFETINKEKVLIGVMYHSGSSTEDNTQDLHNVLRSEIFNSFDRVVICGDYNYPTAKWDGSWSNEKDESFYEAVRDGFFTQHVNKPTRYREGQQSNVLDLVFTRDERDINDIFYCSPLGKSDHVMLKIITSIPTTEEKCETSRRYDWAKGNYAKMREYIANVDWSVLNEMDVEGCWVFIKSKLQ